MNKPRPQELYRHFKGNLYQVLTIAIHSETREEMVVYQALYGDYKVYCRPLDMFMSEVDRNKYPNAAQKMRFERVDNPAKADETEAVNHQQTRTVTPQTTKEQTDSVREVVRPQLAKDDVSHVISNIDTSYKHSEVMDKSIDQEAEELNLDPLVIEFLDAELASDRLGILSKLRPTITNDMIDIMAMGIGVVVEEGDVYDRYNDLRTCLTTVEKFESNRLRS